jgi:hypothetical protein
VFRLIKWLISVILLGAFVYFAVTVPVGSKTLWGHVKAIASSKESKELVDGVKNKVDRTMKDSADSKAGDKLLPKEREALRKLIRDKLKNGDEG